DVEEELASPDAASELAPREVAQPTAWSAFAPLHSASREVVGRVVDGKGAPVAGASVFVGARGHTEDALIATVSDAEGYFVLSDVDPEAWISADGDGWMPSGWASVRAIAVRRDTRVELSLRVARATTQFAGFVRDPVGRPIHGARVFILAESLVPWFQQG